MIAGNVNERLDKAEFLKRVRFSSDGLVPAIVQEYATGAILMMAWMNNDSLQRTISTGRTWFWSRSRKELWAKGETSGDIQMVRDIAIDCDGDALVVEVVQHGKGACHTGNYSCFFTGLVVQDSPEA